MQYGARQRAHWTIVVCVVVSSYVVDLSEVHQQPVLSIMFSLNKNGARILAEWQNGDDTVRNASGPAFVIVN